MDHDSKNSWLNRGIALGQIGQYQEELDNYERALALDPNQYKAWFNRGIVLGQLGCIEEEIESYKRALDLNPGSYKPWYIGLCLCAY